MTPLSVPNAESTPSSSDNPSAVHDVASRLIELDSYPYAWRVYQTFPKARIAPWQKDSDQGWIIPCPSYRGHDCVIMLDGPWFYCRAEDRHGEDECPGGEIGLARLGAPSLAERIAETAETGVADMVIPGLLAPGDRIILTGGEGHGKTTLGRQVALQTACGVHPFTLEPMPAKRVVFVDLEVGERYTLAGFTDMGKTPENQGNLRVEIRPGGINLGKKEDRDWLSGLARKADLLVIGPLYKMHDDNIADDGPAKDVINALDSIRGSCAVWIEAHQPHASNGNSRTLRPYGSSTFLRWPEFGIHLAKDGKLRHWRGSRCPDREWPESLERGTEWPWMVAADKRKPWEKAGVSRSAYYRQVNKEAEDAA